MLNFSEQILEKKKIMRGVYIYLEGTLKNINLIWIHK